MVKNNIPEYSDDVGWKDIITRYTENPNSVQYDWNIEDRMWTHFTSYLCRNDRYFFSHPMLDLLEKIFFDHVFILDADTSIYRARIDYEKQLLKEWFRYSAIGYAASEYQDLTLKGEDTSKYWENLDNSNKRIKQGFQGFDEQGSTAPPSDKASPGRCNLQGVSYLYTALDEHTAVAEVRPLIGDHISIATLQPIQPLRLVSFDYDPDGVFCDVGILFRCVQHEYDKLNRTGTGDYTVTQYLTSYVAHLGYDGLCFRSSLVRDGTNFVIFDPKKCKVISSKLCRLNEVKYSFDQYKR